MDWELFRPSRATATCLILLTFSFLLMAFRLTSTVQALRSFLFYWVAPSYESMSAAINAATGIGARVGELIRAHKENVIIKEKSKEIVLMESLFREKEFENERLKKLLGIRETFAFQTVPAVVTGRDLQNWMSAIWINRGLADGVDRDSPVVAVEGDLVEGSTLTVGVVGRVLECGPNSSKVLLLSDPLSSIAVTLSRNQEQGLVQGQGFENISVEYLNQAEKFEIGDEVVTSGLGGIFPAGLPVGKLSRIWSTSSGFIRAEIKPAASLNELREVLVLNSRHSRHPKE